MAENPLKSLIPKDSQGEGMGKELAEKANQVSNARRAINPASEAPKAAPIGAPAHMTPAQGPFGSRPGEKRIDVTSYQKPLGQMHKGGTVPKTGPYVLKAGEKVLTGDQHGHIKNALSLAQTALSHDPAKDEAPELPKHLREMHIKELHTGGFHVTKHDGKGGVTDHGAPHNDSVIGHFMDHMAHPDEDEEDVEAGNHDMSAAAAEHKAIGG